MDALQSAANHTLQVELRDQNNVISLLGFKASGSPWNAEHNTNELAIDACGPVSNNARGIAEMAGMSHRFYETTEALDAAGNTNAVIGKFVCRFVGCGVILEFCSANAVYLVHSLLPLSFITPFTAIVGDITPYDGIPKHEKKTTRARSTAARVNYLVEGHKIDDFFVHYLTEVFELKEYHFGDRDYTGLSLELEISIVTGLSIL